MNTNIPVDKHPQKNDQDEAYLNGLLVRISELEKEQKLSRTQIQRLATDKKRIKEMLHELAQERNNIKNRHEQQESVNSNLIVEIKNKALEERKLRQQMKQIQKQAEQEIKKLKEERDTALALIKKQTVKIPFYQQHKLILIITVIVVICLITINLWLRS